MTKEQQRAELEALMAGKPVTKLKAQATTNPALSASRVVATAAKTAIEKRLEAKHYAKPKRVKRNWEAQARYDEQHGTSNGYDERLEDTLAMHNHGMGDY